MRVVVALVVVSSVLGCGSDAVFNLTIDLPVNNGSEPVYAFIQARPADDYVLDGAPWIAAADPDGELLDHNAPIRTGYSYRSSPPGEALLLKVRFCGSPRCNEVGDDLAARREVWVTFARVFYTGRQTHYDLNIETIPEGAPDATAGAIDSRVVDRCEVRGCVDGETSDYCFSEMVHACER